jgi:hypothetical protein
VGSKNSGIGSYIGSPGGQIGESSTDFQNLRDVILQNSGVNLTPIEISSFYGHLDRFLSVLPTGDIYTSLDQGPTTHVGPADTAAAMSGSGVSPRSVEQIARYLQESGHRLFVGMGPKPKWSGGGRWGTEPRQPDGFIPVKDLSRRWDSISNVTVLEKPPGNTDLTANSVALPNGNIVFQEAPPELLEYLKSQGFEPSVIPGAQNDAMGGLAA